MGNSGMSARPTKVEFAQLLAFLPVFSSPDFGPVRQMHGGEIVDGAMQFPWPEYRPEVGRFIQAASKECWQDQHYSSEDAALMVAGPDRVESATLEQIRSMLTYCVRGERFCDGHIGEMISSGHLVYILERLWDIEAKMEF